MPVEDKFKRELDKIGLALAKLLGLLLHKPFDVPAVAEDFAQQLRTELDVDLYAFLGLEHSESLNYLVNDKRFSTEHLKKFGDLLYELGHKTNDAERHNALLQRAGGVYEYVKTNSGSTVYFDVELRLKELRV